MLVPACHNGVVPWCSCMPANRRTTLFWSTSCTPVNRSNAKKKTDPCRNILVGPTATNLDVVSPFLHPKSLDSLISSDTILTPWRNRCLKSHAIPSLPLWSRNHSVILLNNADWGRTCLSMGCSPLPPHFHPWRHQTETDLMVVKPYAP